MRKKNHKSLNLNLEWYVLMYSWREEKNIYDNIFNYSTILEDIEDELRKYKDYNSFKRKINSLLMCYFWSKAEYEIIVGNPFEKDLSKNVKIDVYTQIKPNLDILCKYIIHQYNNRKYGRKKIEI